MEKEHDNLVVSDRLKGALVGLILAKRVKHRFDREHNIKSDLEEPQIYDSLFCSQAILYIESYLNWLEQILDNGDFFNPNSTDILIEAYNKWYGYTTSRLDNETFWSQTEENTWLNEYMRSNAQFVEENPVYRIDAGFFKYYRDRAFVTAGAICSITHSFDFYGEVNRKAWINRLCHKAYKEDYINQKDYMLIWLNIMYAIINIENNIYANEADGKMMLASRIAAASYIGTTAMGYQCYTGMSEFAKTLSYPKQTPYSDIVSEIINAFGERSAVSKLPFCQYKPHTASFNGMLYGFERMHEAKNEIHSAQMDYIDKLVKRIISMRERIDALLSADNDRLRNCIVYL